MRRGEVVAFGSFGMSRAKPVFDPGIGISQAVKDMQTELLKEWPDYERIQRKAEGIISWIKAAKVKD